MLTDAQLEKECRERGLAPNGGRNGQLRALAMHQAEKAPAASAAGGGKGAATMPVNLQALPLDALMAVCASHGLRVAADSSKDEVIAMLEEHAGVLAPDEAKAIRDETRREAEEDDDEGEGSADDEEQQSDGDDVDGSAADDGAPRPAKRTKGKARKPTPKAAMPTAAGEQAEENAAKNGADAANLAGADEGADKVDYKAALKATAMAAKAKAAKAAGADEGAEKADYMAALKATAKAAKAK